MNDHDIETVQLSALITSAMITANNRGHSLLRTEPVSRTAVTVWCDRCGAEATCDIRPLPNGIDIGGELVALGCDPTRGTK